MPADPALVARVARPGDEPGLLEMYERCLGRARSAAEMRWWAAGAPGGPARRWVAAAGERVVGHVGLEPLPTWIGGERGVAGLGCHQMVLPEWQGKGVSRLLADAIRSDTIELDFAMSFPLEATQSVIIRLYPEYQPQGRVTQWVRWHRARALEASRGRPLPGVTRPAASALLGAVSAVRALPSPGVAVREELPADRELDDLGATSAGFASCIVVRDAAHVRWRWLDNPHDWRVVTARGRAGDLRGFAVFGAIERDGQRRGRIVDLLAADARATRALVGGADERLSGDGCDIVLCEYADPRPWSRRAMLGAGFLPRGMGPFNNMWARSERATDAMRSPHAWYLTLGDTDHL